MASSTTDNIGTVAQPSLRSLIKPGVSKRNDFPLVRSSMALLVIDIQRELTKVDMNSNEYKYSTGFPRMLANTKRLIDAVRNNREKLDTGSEVIFTYLQALTDNSRDVSFDYKLSGPLSNLPTPSSPAKFFPGITPVPGKDIALPKTSCSVFQSTNLDYILRNLNVEQLVICGQLTDQCVESAVRDAADLGYLVSVVDDACGAETEDCHQKGLHGMKGFARMVTTDQVLQELSDNSRVVVSTTQGQPEVLNDSIPTIADTQQFTMAIQKTSDFIRKKDYGCHAAILRSLRAAGIEFLRYAVVDAFNTIRCKSVPLKHALSLLPKGSIAGPSSPLDNPVSIAEVCFAGLPTSTDVPVLSSNLDARNVLTLHPDFSSLRILPYAPRTAMIMCTAHNQQTGELSPLCTRGLLERVLNEARESAGIEFCVGAELEFQLFHRETRDGIPQPVDTSTFANAITLNEQEDFISTLYNQLCEQDIQIELIHAESAPGQAEVVLSYSSNVMQLADDVVLARETISACAKKYGMKALFLPKTSMMTAGCGLHLHFSFKDIARGSLSDNAFSDSTRPTGISLRGESFMEGILGHLSSLLGFTLPTNNSYRRMGPGCWTGSALGWSTEDKEVPLRVCLDLSTHIATNVEYKLSDATANIYLELAMILAAGMDGMKHEKRLRPMMTDMSSDPLPESLMETLGLLKKNETLLSVLGIKLSTAYIAVRESEAQNEETLEAEVADAFNKA